MEPKNGYENKILQKDMYTTRIIQIIRIRKY